MMRKRIGLFVTFLLLLGAVAEAREFYESYDEGLKAVKAKQWSVVIQKMTEAIAANPNESDRARSYGTNFFKYHPYYYRGIAYFSTDQFEKAISDLQKATGAGAENLGTVDSFISRAETRLTLQQQQQQAQQNPPPPPPPTYVPPPPTTTRTQVNVPPPPPPSQVIPPPSGDGGVSAARNRASANIRRASDAMNAAKRAKADIRAIDDFSRGQQMLLDARSRAVNANTSSDWDNVANIADKSSLSFEAAIERARNQSDVATGDVIKDVKSRVKDALDLYFNGDFHASAEAFESLTRDQERNAMIWAFLGASRYYNYLLDGESSSDDRRAAEDAFRRARKINPTLQLSSKYFSPRIQKFYDATR